MVVSKGISGIFFQSIILREIFSNFFGNEISFSFVISFWLLGGAIGSFLFRKIINYRKFYIFFTIFEPFFLISSIIFLRIWLNIQQLFYSNLKFFIFSFLISFFSGFFEGARFILLSFLYKEEKSSGKVYGFEAIGFLIGGFLFSLFLIFKKDIFFLIFLSSIINISTILFFEKKFSLLLIFFIFLLPFSKKIDFKTNSMKYKGFDVKKISDTFYNKLILLNKETQYILLSNGFQEFSNQPDYFSIKNISFSISFSEKTQKIGIIGNPEIIEEIEKYKIGEIYFFEIDNEKTEIIKEYFFKKDFNNIFFVNADIKRFLKENRIKFDTIIITNSQIMNLKENYFLTDEFFKEISKFTKNIVIVLPGTYDYLGKQILRVHSSIYKTAKKYFKNEIFLFTYPLIYIGSNEKLKLNRNLIYDREFFNEWYLKYVLDENKKNDYLSKILNLDFYENTVSNPFCLYSSILYYFSQTSPKIGNIMDKFFLRIFKLRKYLFFILFILFLVFLIFPDTYSTIIFTNGFSSLTFETIFIFLFQIIFGFIYGFISGIIGIFMAGISSGSLISIFKKTDKKTIFYSEIFHFLFYILSVFLLINGKLNLFLVFFSGFLTGWEFGIISSLIKNENIVKITGKIYSIDLFGALFSSLFLPLFFIPALGIYGVLYLIPILKFSNLLKFTFLSKNLHNFSIKV